MNQTQTYRYITEEEESGVTARDLLLGEKNIYWSEISQVMPARPSHKVDWKQGRRLGIEEGEAVESGLLNSVYQTNFICT
jgi:hypothetical protein